MHLIEQFLTACAVFITWVISSTGYAGVAILMAIESACIPLPSEIIMPFAGYLVSTGEMQLWAVATAGAIGCNIGSIPAYEIGKHGGRAAVARFGRYVFLNMHDLDRAEAFFRRFGSAAVFICRLLPLVRSFIAFPAGMARMPLGRFHLYTFLGSWPFCWVLAWIGMKLGQAWNSDPRLREWFHRLDYVIVALVLAGGIFLFGHKIKQVRAARRNP
ncbi:MAG: DedA family protein [Sphingomonas fennica]